MKKDGASVRLVRWDASDLVAVVGPGPGDDGLGCGEEHDRAPEGSVGIVDGVGTVAPGLVVRSPGLGAWSTPGTGAAGG